MLLCIHVYIIYKCVCPLSPMYSLLGQVLFVKTLSEHIYTIPFYLLPVVEGCGREIIKRLTYLCASVCSSRFYINLNISFIYKDIFTKFAGNVYGYGNLSAQNFGLILKNTMAAIANCLKIIKVLEILKHCS